MGWFGRRIAGFLTFAIVSATLGAYAVSRGWISGEPTRSTTSGVVVLGTAFLASLVVTTRMKRREQEQRAWEANAQAWQAYYAQMVPGYGRQR